jgi:hypothetical protein
LNNTQKYHSYSGVIHIHSTYSDGSRNIPDIASIANELDIDFLLFTDHNTLKPKFDGLEGWYDKVLVGIGCEINDVSDQNHYLAFDIDEEVSWKLPPKEYVKKVGELGGFGIIAHPDEKRTTMPEYPIYPWTVWDSREFNGIELWNQMSEWMEGLNHLNKFYRFIHPRKSVAAPKKETLNKWDMLNLERKVIGIGGVDAHGHIYKLWGLFRITIFRYKVLFRTIRTHVLLNEKLIKGENYQKALHSLYGALKNAQCYISNVALGDAGDFRMIALSNREEVTIGGTISLSDSLRIKVSAPQGEKIVLIRNGELLREKTGGEAEFKADKDGVYRVEVYKNRRPWIFSNHIRVVKKESLTQSREAAKI